MSYITSYNEFILNEKMHISNKIAIGVGTSATALAAGAGYMVGITPAKVGIAITKGVLTGTIVSAIGIGLIAAVYGGYSAYTKYIKKNKVTLNQIKSAKLIADNLNEIKDKKLVDDIKKISVSLK